MIKSCEDVTTMDEFDEFMKLRLNTLQVGLIETAGILRWDSAHNIHPDTVQTLIQR